jgi:Protein of unknown function (DUF4080)
VYNPAAPYNVLSTSEISFAQMQRMQRFARYWDMFANSGRFVTQMRQLLAGAPFQHMMTFADWLYASTDATHRLSLPRQAQLLNSFLLEAKGIAPKLDQTLGVARKIVSNSLPRQARHAS